MLKDLRYAVRLLLQSKGWTAVVVVSLALGIGVNTTLFSALNALLLKTLPAVREPERVVRLRWSGKNRMIRSSSVYGYSEPNAAGEHVHPTFSFHVYERLRESGETLTGLAACAPGQSLNVSVKGRAELASSYLVSGNYFEVLGVPALIGRTITPDDDLPSAAPVAMVSHAYWSRRFGRDAAVVGLEVTVNETPVTIVGVTPPDYIGLQRLDGRSADFQLPLHLDSEINLQKRLSQPTNWWLQIAGRMKPGVTPERVKGQLQGVFQAAALEGWNTYLAGLSKEDGERALSEGDDPSLDVASAARGIYDANPASTTSLWMLGVVSVLVLLIVCANVANLLLSKAGGRGAELSIRLGLGATRGRLIRQMLTESLLLAVLGGGLALLVTYWSRGLLPFGSQPPMEWSVFAFAAATSLLTGLAFGVLPALRATRLNLADSLKDRSRSFGPARAWLSKGLLVAQVAISVVLLVGAGLFLRTLRNLRDVEVGFNTGDILLARIDFPVKQLDKDRSSQLQQRLREAFAAIPGVESASFSATALLSGGSWTSSAFVPGRDPAKGPAEFHMMTVSPEFFETVEIPILLGRGFSAQDTEGAPRVAVVNETAAREYFPEGSPLGRRFGFSAKNPEQVEVVGVIADTKYSSVREAAPATVYQPHLQKPLFGSVTYELRTALKPESLAGAVREAARRVDPNVPVGNITTQAEEVENRFSQERTFALAYSLFGALALGLACIGLFGLMSYSVVQRTHEIGVRLALGAQRREIVGMVLRESMILVAVGVSVGLAGAFFSGRLIESLLFDLAPTDPLTWVTAVSLLTLVAALAGYLPARRASRLDPLIALRCE